MRPCAGLIRPSAAGAPGGLLWVRSGGGRPCWAPASGWQRDPEGVLCRLCLMSMHALDVVSEITHRHVSTVRRLLPCMGGRAGFQQPSEVTRRFAPSVPRGAASSDMRLHEAGLVETGRWAAAAWGSPSIGFVAGT